MSSEWDRQKRLGVLSRRLKLVWHKTDNSRTASYSQTSGQSAVSWWPLLLHCFRSSRCGCHGVSWQKLQLCQATAEQCLQHWHSKAQKPNESAGGQIFSLISECFEGQRRKGCIWREKSSGQCRHGFGLTQEDPSLSETQHSKFFNTKSEGRLVTSQSRLPNQRSWGETRTLPAQHQEQRQKRT